MRMRSHVTAAMQRFPRGRNGNVAIMTALVLPAILLAMLGGVNLTMALSKRQVLADVAQIACTRAVKPLRMKILNDADRTKMAQTGFDALAAERKLTIQRRTVTSGWLTATVSATALIPTMLNETGNTGYVTTVNVTCDGLPPFPKVDDVILSSNFVKPDGAAIPMKFGWWGIYQPSEFGWDGGTGYGVEIQRWDNAASRPPGSTNPYVIEMDSDNGSGTAGNSSMYKTVELHKGVYRFSFWYYGRSSNAETNIVTVYLEGARPVSPKVLKLTAKGTNAQGWQYKTFDIPVATYSLYKLWIAAEGIDDSYGGIFNDMKLEYIKRPFDT